MLGFVAYLVALSTAVAAGTGQAVPEAGPAMDTLGYGDRGGSVEMLNDALARAGFHPDDGPTFGRQTRHAVYAFQKHHNLPTTGTFTPFMWDLLTQPVQLPWRPQPDRVEVDLAKQVLYIVEDHQVTLILPISSGSGGVYRSSEGGLARATTPEGAFRFQRRIKGIRNAPLGMLYNPFYFRGGYAIHGSPSVPNYPASHGCIRVTMWDMDLLLDYLEVGQAVYIYGKRTPPPPVAVDDPSPRLI